MQLDFDPSVDYYKALGLDAKASAAEIKKVYRKLAKQYHPDSTGGDKAKEARFKEINAAYDVLSDATRRQKYDQVRAMGGGRVRTTAGGAGFGGFPGFGGAGPAPGAGFDLGDLFAQVFQQGSAQRGGRTVRFEQGGDDDAWRFQSRPPRGGEAPLDGRVQASDGSWLTVKGGDVYSDVRVGFDRAILGTVAEVATIDGSSSVKIPRGTSSGRKLRLRGKGVIGPTGQVGDHYVTVHLDVPAELDDRAQKLLHDLITHLTGGGTGRRGR
jgi:molecular chaperone DnaJ